MAPSRGKTSSITTEGTIDRRRFLIGCTSFAAAGVASRAVAQPTQAQPRR